MIEVPPKIWRPKPKSNYVPVDLTNDIDDDLFLFPRYGAALLKRREPFEITRDDIYMFDMERDLAELDAGFKIGDDVDDDITEQVRDIIMRRWDCFYEAGARHPILGFEFSIDTGGATPTCCAKPHYGPHESKIIMTNINSLIFNDWIEECGGPWGSLIVLAPKPHQEHIDDIHDFIWRMCVSYRKLNTVTLPFEYPIPRCDDALDDFGDGFGRLWFISIDARQGYHQIVVKKADRPKTAFFGPDHKKYCFKVMPFGPKNAPAAYTAMLRTMQVEWDELFDELYPNSAHKGCRVIIDDVLLFSSDIQTLLNYLDCVLQVLVKYRVSLKLPKCDFLKNRFEYVGHDITADGNCPAESKFNLITDWTLPSTGQGLRSFVSLCNYYHRFCPWFEIGVKPFRALISEFHRQPIPRDRWTPDLEALFSKLKHDIVSSPLLARFDSSKPCFLKTDWSAEGFGFILMQPDDSDESTAALEHLRKTGECKFDLTLKGARLRPIRFGSRRCTEKETHYHSFVGEAAVGRWGIGMNRKFLWGSEFYWLCDCSGVKEILEYDGPIHQVRRWAQELLGYFFHIVHRPARMMADVDAFTRRYGPLVTAYLVRAYAMHTASKTQHPAAYDPSMFADHPTKCPAAMPTPATTTPLPADDQTSDTPFAQIDTDADTTVSAPSPIPDSASATAVSTHPSPTSPVDTEPDMKTNTDEPSTVQTETTKPNTVRTETVQPNSVQTDIVRTDIVQTDIVQNRNRPN